MGQNNNNVKIHSLNSVMFCGKEPNEKSILSINTEELMKCDWILTAGPEDLQIFEFRLSIVPMNTKEKYSEITIEGDQIPKEYRNRILENSTKIFIEYIKAQNLNADSINLKPFTIRILS
jgi:hypothetical protein